MNQVIDEMMRMAEKVGEVSPRHAEVLSIVVSDMARIASLMEGREYDELDALYTRMMVKIFDTVQKSGVHDELAQTVALIKAKDILNK